MKRCAVARRTARARTTNAPIIDEGIDAITFCCLVRKVEVTARYTRAAGPHEAGLAYRQWLAVLVENVNIVIWSRNANAEGCTKSVWLDGVDDRDLWQERSGEIRSDQFIPQRYVQELTSVGPQLLKNCPV